MKIGEEQVAGTAVISRCLSSLNELGHDFMSLAVQAAWLEHLGSGKMSESDAALFCQGRGGCTR